MVVSGAVLGAILTIIGVLIAILSSVIGWSIKKLLDMEDEVAEISQSYTGTSVESGHLQQTKKEFERVNQNLDDLQDLVCSIERRREEEHEEVKQHLVDVIEVLRESDINNGLPSPSDIESDD